MAITPTQENVQSIFSHEYCVDFYQREYKWRDTPQNHRPIASLLNDIFYRFDISYNSNIEVKEESISKYDWYYLNSFMTNTLNGKVYIVDGQQRLTTLTLILMALYKIGESLNVNIKKLKHLEKFFHDINADGEDTYLMGFNGRNEAFAYIFDGDDAEKPNSENISIANIFAAYNVIYDMLVKKLVTDHLWDAFRLFFLQRIYLIKIDVDESKDVAMTFEVINDRGVPLSAFEILKGKLLCAIEREYREPYIETLETAINNILEVGDSKDSAVNDFFSCYFQSKYADSEEQYRKLNESQYYKNCFHPDFNEKIGFQTGNKKNINKIKEFLSKDGTLQFYSNLYIKMLKDSTNDDKVSYTWFNHVNDQKKQFYLVLSAISENDSKELQEEKYQLVTREFDRIYVLTNLVGAYKSNDFSSKMNKLGILIREKSLEEIRICFRQMLVTIINEELNRNEAADSDPINIYELFKNASYVNLSKKFLRYFFARIEHFIAEKAKIDNVGTYYQLINQTKGNNAYHIEHILAFDDAGINRNKFDTEEEFNQQRNRLGDLLLLRGPSNQSSNNEIYDDKLKTYSHETIFAQTLREDFYHCNPEFDRFCETHDLKFEAYNDYGQDQIENRQKLLHSIIQKIWE